MYLICKYDQQIHTMYGPFILKVFASIKCYKDP